MASTVTSRRKIVQAVKAATYGTALRVVPRHSHGNSYMDHNTKGKRYGHHRKAIADEMKRVRKAVRSKGIAAGSKALRGVRSVDTWNLR